MFSDESNDWVWIFKGEQRIPGFPSAVFSSKDKAWQWIEKQSLSGTLTKYPLNISVYEWATQNQYFSPTKEHHETPRFVANFSSAALEHYHFNDGICEAGVTAE